MLIVSQITLKMIFLIYTEVNFLLSLSTIVRRVINSLSNKNGLLRIYSFSILSTLSIWAFIGFNNGISAAITVILLTILEVTFSFDNAVINGRILVTLSKFWQTLFLTVGIFLAVFVVRFFVPLLIVAITADLSIAKVADLALNQPLQYAAELHKSAHLIDAFGGTFLLLVGASFFIDSAKKHHWLSFIEKPLSAAGKLPNFTVLSMMAITGIIYYVNSFRYSPQERNAILMAGIVAITLYIVMGIFDKLSSGQKKSTVKHKVGMAAFMSFMYLQLLDASFSLDGVIGAFAITSSVVLIAAGLGAGAVWVRSMTVHLVRTGTLTKYKYLEHGAHWAIICLGLIMLIRLYGLELPEWATGSVGLVFIVSSVVSSIRRK